MPAGEDRFRDHRAGGQADEGEADDRDDGDQGIAEDVLHRHASLGEALGPGRGHVALPEDIEHAGPGQADDQGGVGGRQCRTGKDQYT